METKTKGSTSDPFINDFKAMPLDEKFSRLFRMEAVALGEAVNFVVGETMKVIERGGEMLNDLGTKMGSHDKATSGTAGAAGDKEKAKRSPGTSKKTEK